VKAFFLNSRYTYSALQQSHSIRLKLVHNRSCESFPRQTRQSTLNTRGITQAHPSLDRLEEWSGFPPVVWSGCWILRGREGRGLFRRHTVFKKVNYSQRGWRLGQTEGWLLFLEPGRQITISDSTLLTTLDDHLPVLRLFRSGVGTKGNVRWLKYYEVGDGVERADNAVKGQQKWV
jgi:hypothetical protein